LAYEYSAIEEKPLFGGETAPEKSIEALESYVAEKAQSMGFSHGNSCYVSFVISSTGKVINAQIVRGKSSEFNQAALEIITELPDWTPGSANGANVNVAYTIDVVL
jgi:TonB family protein